MEKDESVQSEELEVSEAPDSEDQPDDAAENEEAAESFNQNAEQRIPTPKPIEEEQTSPPISSPSSTFNWDVYLREQNAEAAPLECFFQPETPPTNKFQIGTKLMIADPRGPTGSSAMFCLGTVVNVYKLWLCVRLEGLDNSHEKWIFCDDDSIQPIGDSVEDHMKLNPPIGFIHHHGSFPKFLEQHLKPDEETGASVLCPAEWFNPISETLRPCRNHFKVGQKVEAIDQRSFNGKTCPATIVEVTKTQIQIHFDGWNNGYDIKEPYYTRCVMPVGWSQKNGVEISPPKTAGKSGKASTSAALPKQPAPQKQRHRSVKTKHRSMLGHHRQSTSKPVIQRLSDLGVTPLQSVRHSRITKRPPSSSLKAALAAPTKKVASESAVPIVSQPVKPTYHGAPSSVLNGSLAALEPADLRSALQQTQPQLPGSSVEDKVKDLLMNAKAEQQKLAKQLSQPPMVAYFSSTKCVRVPPPLPQRAQASSSPEAQFHIKNEAEEVVSSTTASVDTPSSTGVRPLIPPSSSQLGRDLAKVVGQIRPKMSRDQRAGSDSPASSSISPMCVPVPSSTSLPNTSTQPRSHDVLLLSKDEIPLKERLMTVFVNYSCCIGPLLDPAMVAGIRRKFGPFATHHALREAVQQLLNCARDDSVVLNLVQPAAVTQILSVTAHCGGVPRSRFIPCVKSAADAWNYLKQLLRKMKVCENFYSSTGDPCPNCDAGSDLNVDQIVASSLPLKQWTIEKVAFELRKILDETAVSKFVEQQIDGRSLGLLTTELLMNYMGLALGPALKVIDFVESVRKKQENQRSSTVEAHPP
ncbi:hypothetical protein Q1695_015568 [Nippostrongylus brasiliensis]|nr:hypothetical protein Q1695_015568 [Nippostrongylus brasiliensis]